MQSHSVIGMLEKPCRSSSQKPAAGWPDSEVANTIRDEHRRIADQSRRAWNARHDAEAARRRQQEDEMAAQFRRELDGLDEITGRS